MGGDPTATTSGTRISVSSVVGIRPYDFQLEGMEFLEAGLVVNKGAAYFDEMGLGKTIQAVA